jgi:xanthosine utilization system XapX-like protein
MRLTNTLLAGALASAAILGAMVGGSIVEGRKANTEPTNLADYWDAHGCVNHLDGTLYEGTAE